MPGTTCTKESLINHRGKEATIMESGARKTSLLKLVTKGRKTGKDHTVELMQFSDDDRMIVIASKGGSPTHPDWYLNLVANPTVQVNIAGVNSSMYASTATAADKKRLWAQIVAKYPLYEEFQYKTSRDIPLVILSPK